MDAIAKITSIGYISFSEKATLPQAEVPDHVGYPHKVKETMPIAFLLI
jgi:hypothetical protein